MPCHCASQVTYDTNEMPFAKERAVIINCGTRLTTTLAILSALRYLGMPVLVVDCPIKRNSIGGMEADTSDLQYLSRLKALYSFDLVQLPLRAHGDTLDYLFLNLQAEYVCLIDSDLEILNSDGISFMRRYADDGKIFGQKQKIFGSGFVQVSGKGLPPQEGWFHMERMWIPFTYLKVDLMKRMILKGKSFNITHEYNDFPANQKVGERIFHLLRRIERKFPKTVYRASSAVFHLFRRPYGKSRPSLVAYDTGSKIYESLEDDGYLFIGTSFYVADYYCRHFGGATRQRIYPGDPVAARVGDVGAYVKERLCKEYSFNYEKFDSR